MTDTESSPPLQCYRDLLQERANGTVFPDAKLARWRREEQLLRSVVDHPRAYRNIGIVAGHFEAPLHAICWQAIERLWERYPEVENGDDNEEEITVPRIVHEMTEVSEEVSGNCAATFMQQMMHDQSVDPKFGVPKIVQDILAHHRNKRYVTDMDELAERVDNDKDVTGVQADFIRTAASMVWEAGGDGMVSQAMSDYDWDARNKTCDDLVKIGIDPIDRYAAGGHGRGELLVWGGGTGHGKSYAAQSILREQARLEQRTLYISCEDNYELIYCRTLADYSEGRLSPAAIREKKADPDLVEEARQRLIDNQKGNIFVTVAKKPTISQVCDLIRTHRFSKDVDLVIVDYLQAIRTDEDMSNKVQEMAVVTSQLKRTAFQCGVALVAMSQYARDQYRDNTEPNINACKYCGDIENESEIMVLMWRDADGVLHAKMPKIKWAAARNLRFTIEVNPVNGCHGQWMQEDPADLEEEDDR